MLAAAGAAIAGVAGYLEWGVSGEDPGQVLEVAVVVAACCKQHLGASWGLAAGAGWGQGKRKVLAAAGALQHRVWSGVSVAVAGWARQVVEAARAWRRWIVGGVLMVVAAGMGRRLV